MQPGNIYYFGFSNALSCCGVNYFQCQTKAKLAQKIFFAYLIIWLLLIPLVNRKQK